MRIMDVISDVCSSDLMFRRILTAVSPPEIPKTKMDSRSRINTLGVNHSVNPRAYPAHVTCGHLYAVEAGLEGAFTVDASRVTFGEGSLLEVGDRTAAR